MSSFAKCAQCALSSVLQLERVAAQNNMQYTDCTLGHKFVHLQCKFGCIKSDPYQTLSRKCIVGMTQKTICLRLCFASRD